MTHPLSCPTCQRLIEWTEQFPYRPFCSERCRLIDLGAWLSERHSIADQSAESRSAAAFDTDDLRES